MKKIFTLIFALISVTSMFATDAEDMASVFRAASKATKVTFTLWGNVNTKYVEESQTVSFTTNKSDNSKIDMALSELKADIVTMSSITIEGFTVTKSGNSYSLDNHTFYPEISNGSGSCNVDAYVSSSDINIVDKKADITIHVENLPEAMKKLGINYLDVIYSLTLDHVIPTGIIDVTTSTVANGKYIKNGKVVILKNGKEYNTNGQRLY